MTVIIPVSLKLVSFTYTIPKNCGIKIFTISAKDVFPKVTAITPITPKISWKRSIAFKSDLCHAFK